MIVQAMPYPASAGGGPFSPDDLASLEAWYDATALSGADGSGIVTWPDSTGNGWDGAASSTRPTLELAEQNGLAMVRTSGTSRWFSLSSSLLSTATSGCYFAVFRIDADPPDASAHAGPIISGFGTATATPHHPWTDSVIYESFGTDTRKTIGNPTPSLTSTRIYSAHSGPNDYRAYLDGVSLFSTATNTTSFGGTTARRIARCGESVSVRILQGYFGEILLFKNDVLSTSDRQKVEGYLAHKWGLTANLDAGHPYKSVAP